LLIGIVLGPFPFQLGEPIRPYDPFEGLLIVCEFGTRQVAVTCPAQVGDLTRGPGMEWIVDSFSGFLQNLSGEACLTRPVVSPLVARFIL
jgi:hypothetical protein